MSQYENNNGSLLDYVKNGLPHLAVCVCVYIYIYRERERERAEYFTPIREGLLSYI
jgi:hypothetical protein